MSEAEVPAQYSHGEAPVELDREFVDLVASASMDKSVVGPQTPEERSSVPVPGLPRGRTDPVY